MGATHGLAGVAIGAGLVLAARGVGIAVSDLEAALVTTTSAIAAELPDLDLRTSRISRGSSTLTAVPVIGRSALLITFPIAIAGADATADREAWAIVKRSGGLVMTADLAAMWGITKRAARNRTKREGFPESVAPGRWIAAETASRAAGLG